MRCCPDAIVTMGPDGRVRDFSPSAERLFGWSSAEIAGRDPADLMAEPWRSVPGGDASPCADSSGRAIGCSMLVRGRRRDGEEFPAEFVLCETTVGDDRISAAFLRDLSDLDKSQRRADRLERRLARLDRIRALGEMATAMSHELNQPLAAIVAFAGAAQRAAEAGGPVPAQLSEQLDALVEEAVRAGEIMRRMKRLIDGGRVEPLREDINAIVREAARLALRGNGRQDAALQFDLAPGLPPVLADRIQIQQVIVNLVTNAFESVESPEDETVGIGTCLTSSSGPILVSAVPHKGDWVRVTVRDSGPGIQEEALLTIFQPFRSTKPSGAGVGLAICRSIVRAHGGEIWAENNPDGGASFHFTLPVADGG